MILKDENPPSYNIEEIFGSFIFNLHRREVSWKIFRKVKQVDGNIREIQEDEVLFEKTNEYPMLVATTSVALNQSNILNISLLNEREVEENKKIRSLKMK